MYFDTIQAKYERSMLTIKLQLVVHTIYPPWANICAEMFSKEYIQGKLLEYKGGQDMIMMMPAE